MLRPTSHVCWTSFPFVRDFYFSRRVSSPCDRFPFNVLLIGDLDARLTQAFPVDQYTLVHPAPANAAEIGTQALKNAGGQGGGSDIDDDDDAEKAGVVVWAPARVGRAGMPGSEHDSYWPALSLHLDDDHSLIPPPALEAHRLCQTGNRLCVYFVEVRSIHWSPHDRVRVVNAVH